MTICIGVTGPSGNIGSAFVRRGAIPLDIRFSLDNRETVRSISKGIKKVCPDVIINTACKSSPDWCELRENQEDVIKTNVTGPYLLAYEADKRKIPIILLSTDHIFNGSSGPYRESARRTLPANYYGASKLAMETVAGDFDNAKIVRTSNLFWKDDKRVTWYLDEAYKSDRVKVPTFQKRSFMHVEQFIDAFMVYLDRFERMPKVLNISGSETVSWFTFMNAFADAIGFGMKYKFQRKIFEGGKQYVAKRPKKAGLVTDLSESYGIPQFSYKDGLRLLK